MRVLARLVPLAFVGLGLTPALALPTGEIQLAPTAQKTGVPLPTVGTVRLPYANLPLACKADVEKAALAVEAARAKLTLVAKSEKAINGERLSLLSAQAYCCAVYPLALPAEIQGGTTDPAYFTSCHSMLMKTDKGRSQMYYSSRDAFAGCLGLINAAADANKAASSASSSPIVKAALDELRAAEQKLGDQVKACVASLAPTSPVAPASTAPKAVGAACGAPSECASLACIDGKCSVLGVAPGGSCDATHLCGPALDCRDGQCRMPCTCTAPGCFVQANECKKNLVSSQTVRKSCTPIAGVCGFPCFIDGGTCKVDTVEVSTSTQNCALTCL